MTTPTLSTALRRTAAALIAAAAVAAFVLRIWGIQNHFWMLEDQMRDWSIALGSFSSLPLVGPPTHVHGYTIGPAFYWILWAIRVILGPFFENLPHAGGIGQAALQTAADALLMVAIWRRTGNPWIAAATAVVVVTSSFDLALSALVWNPTMGEMLTKTATALVLLNWHRRSSFHLALVAGIAWSSVHAYTGAVFVALSVLFALAVDTWIQRGRVAATVAVGVIIGVVAGLQVPYLIHQFSERFADPAMGVVTGGVSDILAGRAAPEWHKSLTGYRDAVQSIVVTPWTFAYAGSALIIGGLLNLVLFRKDLPLLIVVLLPQVTAVVGYALFLGALDSYYYLSLMPMAVLTVLLPLTAVRWAKPRLTVGVVLLALATLTIPQRVATSRTQLRLPEYKMLVSVSRKLRNLHQPLRAIAVEFPLPPTCDQDFLYRVLGGEMDRSSPWVAVVSASGDIRFINNDLNKGREGNR